MEPSNIKKSDKNFDDINLNDKSNLINKELCYYIFLIDFL